MYKQLKNILVIVSFAIITIFTIWIITTQSESYASSTKDFILVNKAKLDLHTKLEQIARQYHVVIAKEIYLDKGDGSGTYKVVYEKIGSGSLPNTYPQEKNVAILANAPDNSYYYIIGSSLSPRSLASQLNTLGNQVEILNNDIRFLPLKSLIENFRTPTLIMMIVFVTLLLAEDISRLKREGIYRLSGINRVKLLFKKMLRESLFIFITACICYGLGILWLTTNNLNSLYYFGVEAFTLFTVVGVLIVLIFIFSSLTSYLLQNQPINLSIKGKSPLGLIVVIIIIFQGFAVLSSMTSITKLKQANQMLSELQAGQAVWSKNKQYSATTMALSNGNPESVKDFTLRLLNNPTTILAVSPFAKQNAAAVGTINRNLFSKMCRDGCA